MLFLKIVFEFLILSNAGKAADLSVKIKNKIQTITTVFENETIEPQYGFIKNLEDGRGYTAGKVGFCTGCTDLILVVDEYLKQSNPNETTKAFDKIKPVLVKLAKDNSGEVSELGDFPALWKNASQNPAFRQAQDTVASQLYFEPALAIAREVGIKTPLGISIIYDSFIQHGGGEDKDSVYSLVKQTESALKGNPGQNQIAEAKWLAEFLKVRRKTLVNAHNEATRKAWKESVGRVEALEKILRAKNFDLKGTLKLNPYGTVIKVP